MTTKYTEEDWDFVNRWLSIEMPVRPERLLDLLEGVRIETLMRAAKECEATALELYADEAHGAVECAERIRGLK